MGKFCTACGSRTEEGEAFCAECGTPVKQKQDIKPVVSKIEQSATNFVVPVEKKTSSALIGIAVVAVIFCVIIGIFISAVSNNGGSKKDKTGTKSYESSIKTYFKALEKGDWDKYSSVFTDGFVNIIKRNLENSEYSDGEDFIEGMHDSIENQFGNNFKISYSIINTQKIGEGAFNNIESQYSFNYFEKITISELYSVDVSFSVKGDKTESNYTKNFTVAKIESKWYIIKYDYFPETPLDSYVASFV